MSILSDWFRNLYESTGWNFSVFYNAWETEKYIKGVWVAFELAVFSIIGSAVIGCLCLVCSRSRFAPLRWLVKIYVEFFRNTPGLAQIYFLFFGIGSYFHLSTYGADGSDPLISAFGFVVIALSLQYGAFTAEILRAGVSVVPKATVEAVEALGYSPSQAMRYVILPLVLRISLPALGNNMAQIVKSTAMGYAIAVPEALYVAHEIWTEHFNVVEMMNVVLVSYLGLMAFFTLLVKLAERQLRVPGDGTVMGYIESFFGPGSAFAILSPWFPLLLKGFSLNLLISFLAMAVGIFFGVFLGFAQLAKHGLIRNTARTVTLLLRNSPWLVVIFYVMLMMPFEFEMLGVWITVPDWVKAVIAFAFPVAGYMSEIIRGGITSVPTTQWEAADALAYRPSQVMFSIILPQAVRQMVAPTMNLYCSIAMATSLANVVGVQEVMTITQTILTTETRPGLILPAYGLTLILFFVYIFPISLFSRRIEKAWSVGIQK